MLVYQPHSVFLAEEENVLRGAEVDVHGAGTLAVLDEACAGDGPPAEGLGAIVVFVTTRTCARSHYLCSLCHPGEKSPSLPRGDSVGGSNDAGEEEVATSGDVSLSSRRYASAHIRLCEVTHINGNSCP